VVRRKNIPDKWKEANKQIKGRPYSHITEKMSKMKEGAMLKLEKIPKYEGRKGERSVREKSVVERGRKTPDMGEKLGKNSTVIKKKKLDKGSCREVSWRRSARGGFRVKLEHLNLRNMDE